MMNDLTLYLDHEDPGIKGSLSKLLAIVLRGELTFIFVNQKKVKNPFSCTTYNLKTLREGMNTKLHYYAHYKKTLSDFCCIRCMCGVRWPSQPLVSRYVKSFKNVKLIKFAIQNGYTINDCRINSLCKFICTVT